MHTANCDAGRTRPPTIPPTIVETLGGETVTIPAEPAAQGPDVARLIEICAERRRRPPRQTWIEVPFADGVYRFALGREQIKELERVCGYVGRDNAQIPVGIGAIFARMAKGRAFLVGGEIDWANFGAAEVLASEITERDCIETIRLALIGGNKGIVNGAIVPVPPARALQLIDAYVVGQPLEDAWDYAFAALGALITGVAVAPPPVVEEAP